MSARLDTDAAEPIRLETRYAGCFAPRFARISRVRGVYGWENITEAGRSVLPWQADIFLVQTSHSDKIDIRLNKYECLITEMS